MATTKVKAPSTASLKKQVAEQQAQAEKLQKELASANNLKEIYYKDKQELNAEISAVHDLLDVLPNVIGRKKEDGYSEHKLMTRLASFLANRG
jgi:chromosome segregation ATPase